MKTLEKESLFIDHPLLDAIHALNINDHKGKMKVFFQTFRYHLNEHPFKTFFLAVLSFGFYILFLMVHAKSHVTNAIAARKINHLTPLTQKIETHRPSQGSNQAMRHSRRFIYEMLKKIQNETTTIGSDSVEFKKIYSNRELLRLIQKPISKETCYEVSYFHQSPLECKKTWKRLNRTSRTKEKTLQSLDQINLYYQKLRTEFSLTHEEVLRRLIQTNHNKGNSFRSLNLDEIKEVFFELIKKEDTKRVV